MLRRVNTSVNRPTIIRSTAQRIAPLLTQLYLCAAFVACEAPVASPAIGLVQLTVDEDNSSSLRCRAPQARQSIPPGSEAFRFLDSASQRDELPMAEGGVDGFAVECNLARADDGSYDSIVVSIQGPGSRFRLTASGSGATGTGSVRWTHPTTVGETFSSTCQVEISPESDDEQILMQFDCPGLAQSGIDEACRAIGAVFVDSCS